MENRFTLPVIFGVLPIVLGAMVHFNSVNYQGSGCPQDNVYQIFKSAHSHLLSDQDLYSLHEGEHFYTYKYSPAFALLFGTFANLPDLVGIVFWLLLSALVSYVAIDKLKLPSKTTQFLFFLIIAFEWIGSLQSQQTNILIAMTLVIAFVFLEKRNYAMATLLIVATAFIKIFGLAAMLLYLFYPRKEKLAAYSIMWVCLLLILPMVVLNVDQLSFVYESWFNQITHDYGKYSGMSFYSFTSKLSGYELSKPITLAVSFLILLSPLVQIKKWHSVWFRKLTLSALLLWVVIFNHKAESPSYIIAFVGIALWYYSGPRKNSDTILLLFSIFVGAILFTELTPRWFRKEYCYPYHLKALPCTIVWLRVIVEMWLRKPKEVPPETLNSLAESELKPAQ